MNEQPGPATSDFLERLIDKARGADGGLRPRLPSLFEPMPHIGIGMITDAEPIGAIEEDRESVLPAVRVDGSPRFQRAAADTHRDQVAAAGVERQHGHAQAPQPRIDAAPVASLDPAPVPLTVARLQPSSGPLAAPHDSDMPAPARPHIERLVVAAAIDDRPPRSASRLPLAPQPVRGGRRVLGDDGGSEAAPGDRMPRRTGTLVPSPEPAVRRVVVEAQTTSRRPMPEQARIETSASEATRIVNVTIGRVEVRAVQPAPAPRGADAKGPRPMSLGEYLKRRGGGQ